ncbi:hypothetical protein [Flavihumibacter sp. UBA7668]|uniref:hypothetical protein n=1 Tax=Flavihumibacter sp. UBA7668 TaxID=1946542 RepID=UPI0025C21A90|nr:hypothetical protein [Flavihumibacter sp. UBA7668]
MKQFLLSLQKRTQSESFIRLPLEWRLLSVLLLLMGLRLATILAIVVKQLL